MREIRTGDKREYIIQVADIAYDKRTGETLAVQRPKLIGELVRCKDCKHRDTCHRKVSIRTYDEDIEGYYAKFEKLDYCSYGERKEE